MHPRATLTLLLVTACQGSPMAHTGFGSTPGVSTAPATSTGEDKASSSSSGTTTTGEDSGSAGSAADSELPRDLGVAPDFGPGPPVGCKGKIDFLFVISRQPWMTLRQAQLAAAFPQFIETIQTKFADFDYHIMVVDGDGQTNNNDEGWGTFACNDVCPNLACKVGEPCCTWSHPDKKGTPCCTAPDYPCGLSTPCDWAWGAGTVLPAGVSGEANKPCPIDGDLRYLVKGQSNLKETFACIATVGSSGRDKLGQALTAAMKKSINDPGGCNRGFLRKDALLMVTFISNAWDYDILGSDGTPATWAQAVLDAKHGDDKSVVMLSILMSESDWVPNDRIGALVKMFPYHHMEDRDVPDYGPAFVEAASLVETACAGFLPPG